MGRYWTDLVVCRDGLAVRASSSLLFHRETLLPRGLSAVWPVLPDPGEQGLGMVMSQQTPVHEGSCAEPSRFAIHGFKNHFPDSS